MTDQEFARACLAEDRVGEDVTNRALQALFNARGVAPWPQTFVVRAKESGVFSGARWLSALTQVTSLRWNLVLPEGAAFAPGDTVLGGVADWSSVLATERTLLNQLQHSCGVATQTALFARVIGEAWARVSVDTSVRSPKLYHTRKTLGLHRDFDLAAARAGGAELHRRDLSSRVMCKENHKILAARAGLDWEALCRGLVTADPDALIEVETLAEAQLAARYGARALLLDNFTPQQVREAVAALPSDCVLEVSGGLRLNNIADYVIPGVARLSVGALTHGARSLDLSLDWEIAT